MNKNLFVFLALFTASSLNAVLSNPPTPVIGLSDACSHVLRSCSHAATASLEATQSAVQGLVPVVKEAIRHANNTVLNNAHVVGAYLVDAGHTLMDNAHNVVNALNEYVTPTSAGIALLVAGCSIVYLTRASEKAEETGIEVSQEELDEYLFNRDVRQ